MCEVWCFCSEVAVCLVGPVAVQTDALHLSGLVDEAELESRVEAGLEAARVVWRDSLLDSTESAVSKALQKVEVEFTRRLERERVAVEERVRLDWAKDKQQALAQLAEELAAGPGRQAGLSVAVQTAESWEGSMGEAVRQAREQWEEGRGREEAALRVELERRHEMDLKEAVQRVLERAKAHYEGVATLAVLKGQVQLVVQPVPAFSVALQAWWPMCAASWLPSSAERQTSRLPSGRPCTGSLVRWRRSCARSSSGGGRWAAPPRGQGGVGCMAGLMCLYLSPRLRWLCTTCS